MDLGGIKTGAIYFVGGFSGGVLVASLIIRSVVNRKSQIALSNVKDEFIALASHYLLTPISIIQGSLTRLEEQESTLTIEDRRKLYGDIAKGQQRLWILAEQFVLVSQIEGRMLRLKLETGNVHDAVQGALTAVDIFAREKGVKLELHDDTQALQETRFDARRLKQAVVAVLDNAIKFSPEGGVVQIHVIQEPQSFVVQIEDQGPGMSSQAIATAAQRFSRGTSSYTFDHEGIGLGLYTANSIIREHGGELVFESGRKSGTTVILRFPNQ